MGSRAGCVSVEWATEGVLESLALGGSGVQTLVWLPVCSTVVSERRQGLSPCMPSLDCWCLAPESTLRHLWTSHNMRRRRVVGSGIEFTGVCKQVMSSMVQGKACGARAAAMLAHTVSLCVGMLRGLLERAKVLFAIVDLMSVNGTAFRQVRVACETHTGVFKDRNK
eukprot:scaffold10938_cov123-Isochrysis_galbana.AAC.4